jgi:predicted  nucleic acid-binding Zn-ribbon protein
MAADTLDVRMARLEGAYEQINTRLGTLHDDIQQIREEIRGIRAEIRGDIQDIRGELRGLNGKLDTTFRWVIGIVLVNWITLMLAILLRQ